MHTTPVHGRRGARTSRFSLPLRFGGQLLGRWFASLGLALALAGSASVLTACDDPNLLQAQLPTAEDTYDVFALTGTPAAYPSGINTYIRSAVRVDGNANFDVAFDIDDAGKVLIHPVQRVVTSISGNRRYKPGG